MRTMPRQSSFAEPKSASRAPAGNAGAEEIFRIALVDDDDDFREVAGAELGDYGFSVTDFQDGRSLLDYFAAGNSTDVIILDWKLPSMPGIELLSRLQRQGIAIPAVILTALSGITNEMAALDHGALDFIDKSRGIPVLAKRARLIAAAAKLPLGMPVEETIEQGNLRLRPRLSRAYRRGLDVGLTVTEFNVVRLLAEHVGEPVGYRAIYDCVHRCGFIAGSGQDGYRTNVRSAVKRIRNKFRAIDRDFMEIENFPAFGYRWKDPSPEVS